MLRLQYANPSQPWLLHCLDEWGEEVLTYLYTDIDGEWDWQFDGRHPCPYGHCRYTPIGTLQEPCMNCQRDQRLMTLYLGLILLYDSGYYQEIVVREEEEPRTYPINLDGRTPAESERTRPVRPYKTRTRSGKVIDVVPMIERKIPMLQINAGANTEVGLYAEPAREEDD